MNDIAVALGLVLVIEGLVWAIAPNTARRLLEAAFRTPEATLRTAGASAVAIGVFIVWLARG